MEDLTKEASEILESTKGFITNNNYKVVEVKEHYCKLEATVSETSKNHLNICHGGFLFGLADTAGGIAAMTDKRIGVTVNSSINFIKQATTDKIYAETKEVKTGKSISVFDVYITDAKGDLVCSSTFTYMYINKQM